jgi:PAS domain S-box-containing protein
MSPHNRRPRPVEVGGASSNSERAAIDGIDAPQARLSGLHSTFVDDMADGVAFHSAIRDDTGHIVDFLLEGANQAFGRLVDRAHDELVGRRMLELFPTWADGLFDACVQAVETGEPQTGESLPEQPGLQWANVNGRTPSVEISISKLGDGCAISLRDVTARQRVEDELFRSQAMLRSVLDTFPQRVFWKDLNSTFIGCNAAFGLNVGLADPSEIVGIDDFRIHAHDDAERYRADDRKIMRTGIGRIEYEEPMTRMDGTDGWARTSKVPIRDKDGEVIGVLGAYQDITDQKRAQEALRKSERFLDSVIENIPDMVFVKDARKLRFVRFNRAGEELLGYTREELTGKSDHDLFPQHEADLFTQKDREVLRGRQVFDIPEETIRTRYQGERVLHTKKIPMLDEGGHPEYLLGISEDITERKRAEEGRLARLRFAEGMDRVNRAILGTDDLDHMMRDTLDAVLGLFGCDRAWLFYPCDPDASTFRVPMEATNPEYPGAGMFDVDVPLSPDMAENLREALESAGPVTYIAGTARPVNRVSAGQFGVQSQMFSALYPKSGKPWAFGIHQCSHPRVWTSEDEDLFKEIGRRLTDALTTLLARRDSQRSEGEYRRIVDAASEGIWVVGPDDATIFVNARMADMLSRSTNDMIGRPLTDFMFEEDAPDHARQMEARRRGISGHYERRFRRKDGQPLWTHVSATPIFEDEDRFAGSFAMLTDITERRRAEEEARTLNRELERQVLQYRMLLDQASDAIFVTDADGHYIDVNIAACGLLGYSREELLRLSIPDVVPPEENPGQPERFVRMRAGEAIFSERTQRRKDGSLLVAELSSRQLPDGRFQAIVRDITARRLLEKDQARLATAVEQADEAIVITDPSSSILYVNPSFERVTGYTRAELIGNNPRILQSGQHEPAFYQAMWSSLLAGQTWRGTLVNRRKDGSLFEEDAVITPIRDAAGAVVSYVGVKRDITRERSLEAQLRQSQKMEAVGQLAGGIAHDFNNLITAIRGYSEFVREGLPPEDRDDIDQVVLAADRAAELTRQLLAFSRRQVLQPRVIGPAEIVEGIAPMLGRLLGEHIELMVQAAPDVGRIRVDPSKLEQIIVNLAVNARDAMPGGGRLVIETTNAEIDVRSEPSHAEMTPGPYVVLRVTDTGCGMDEETRARVFEPFFTTKEPGSGTGMGLAVVYGIVAASGGEIYLSSELGRGTTFEIYLPRVDEEAIAAAVTTDGAAVPRGSETILLVEDEAGVRTFARRALEGLGYTVLQATNGAEAVALVAEHTGRIDLVVTDVVMPRMGGRELAERLRSARPDLAILFMSGFSGNAVGGADLIPPGAPVLDKPFTREGLGRAVREALAAAE